MTRVAVVAHRKKVLGAGLPALRRRLRDAGVEDPLWYEVPKSREAPAAVGRALEAGADLLFVWGGDGTVQRCIDAVGDADVPIAILPAGTANLLASNLGIPKDLDAAIEVGLHGSDRRIDVGTMNGERFAVMAGVGFDARMVASTGRRLKNRLGRVAYVYTGTKAARADAMAVRIAVDGTPWFEGDASCVLVGNVGTVIGGLEAFVDAEPDDGLLDVGVVTATTPLQWARLMARTAVGRPERSPLASITQGRKVVVKLEEKERYELDGGARGTAKKLEIRVHPGAVRVRVPTGPA